jgi:hypothetical protein
VIDDGNTRQLQLVRRNARFICPAWECLKGGVRGVGGMALQVLAFAQNEAPTPCHRTRPQHVAKNFYAIFARPVMQKNTSVVKRYAINDFRGSDDNLEQGDTHPR